MLPPLRSPYGTPPDFFQLARDAPAVRLTGKGGASIDWKDDAAVRALTFALLERDFKLQVDLPADRLCPTVPSRLEYVLFVLRLALLTSDAPSTSSARPRLVGLDIGTGASCIYPLLAQRTYIPPSSSTSPSSSSQLRMFATDIDARSLSYARRNVAQNGLATSIEVFEVKEEGSIFAEDVVNSVECFDFTMCNPPFYASEEEIASSLAAKELEPFAVCTGAENELVTAGGEVAFVSRMIEESLELGKTKIRWFTSLLGKFSSIAPLVELLKSHKLANYAVTPLPPQGQTTRWVLAWSLQDYRFPAELLYPSPLEASSSPTSANPSNSTTSPPLAGSASGSSTTRFLPPSLLPSTYRLPSLPPTPLEASSSTSNGALSVADVRLIVEDVLRELVVPSKTADGEARGEGREDEGAPLRWTWREGAEEGEVAKDEGREEEKVTIRAWTNVWSRAARRAAVGKRAGEGRGKGKGKEGADEAAAAPATGDEMKLLLEMRLLVRPANSPLSPTGVSAPPPPTNAPSAAAPAFPPLPLSSPHLLALWTRGADADRAMFVGLWGYLVRKVGEAVRARAGGAGDEGREQNGEADGAERAGKRRRVEGNGKNGGS
ncbi:hypothetical protein JCM6882_008610 [Rhodosporidiobolus microsporus]